MSIELTILTAMVALLALLAVLRPAMLFEYPVAASMLMWFFIIPQAWRIEASGDLNDFEPTLTWGYMILCTACTVIGYMAGKTRRASDSADSFEQLTQTYDVGKLFYGAVILTVLGGGGVGLMYNAASKLQPGEAWTGAIAFYAFIAQLLIYGASLAWLLYLYTGQKRALLVALIGFGVNLPAILFAARRELSFIVVVVFLLGLFFVKNKSISRLIMIPMILAGAIFVNQAGEIRGFIAKNNGSLVTAIAASAADETDKNDQFSEVGSGVSDIAVAHWTGDYLFLTPYYNGLVNLYVPAFIVGRDVKDELKIEADDDDESQYTKFTRGGATRTGFADSFQSIHYFGCLIFLLIAYSMGVLWGRAKSGDIRAQLYYMMLISVSLKVFTESTSVFFSVLPVMFIAMGAVFFFARKSSAKNRELVRSVAQVRLRDAHR